MEEHNREYWEKIKKNSEIKADTNTAREEIILLELERLPIEIQEESLNLMKELEKLEEVEEAVKIIKAGILTDITLERTEDKPKYPNDNIRTTELINRLKENKIYTEYQAYLKQKTKETNITKITIEKLNNQQQNYRSICRILEKEE